MERRTARIGVPAYQGQEEVSMKRSEMNGALKEMDQMKNFTPDITLNMNNSLNMKNMKGMTTCL